MSKEKFERTKPHVNVGTIGHVDHGKTTLTAALTKVMAEERGGEAKAFDEIDNAPEERERGITIKAQSVSLDYQARDGQTYQLNFIDTPGHVDFSYEVSRSIAACEGALLIVDAAQSIQAQTISNLYLALENDLEIIPVLNKIDLPSAMPEEVKDHGAGSASATTPGGGVMSSGSRLRSAAMRPVASSSVPTMTLVCDGGSFGSKNSVDPHERQKP